MDKSLIESYGLIAAGFALIGVAASKGVASGSFGKDDEDNPNLIPFPGTTPQSRRLPPQEQRARAFVGEPTLMPWQLGPKLARIYTDEEIAEEQAQRKAGIQQERQRIEDVIKMLEQSSTFPQNVGMIIPVGGVGYTLTELKEMAHDRRQSRTLMREYGRRFVSALKRL